MSNCAHWPAGHVARRNAIFQIIFMSKTVVASQPEQTGMTLLLSSKSDSQGANPVGHPRLHSSFAHCEPWGCKKGECQIQIIDLVIPCFRFWTYWIRRSRVSEPRTKGLSWFFEGSAGLCQNVTTEVVAGGGRKTLPWSIWGVIFC